jgi:hypothetical protein
VKVALSLANTQIRNQQPGGIKGDWTRAHDFAQQDAGIEGSWVHAYRTSLEVCHQKETGARLDVQTVTTKQTDTFGAS